MKERAVDQFRVYTLVAFPSLQNGGRCCSCPASSDEVASERDLSLLEVLIEWSMSYRDRSESSKAERCLLHGCASETLLTSNLLTVSRPWQYPDQRHALNSTDLGKARRSGR